MRDNERIAPSAVELSKVIGRLIARHCKETGKNADYLAEKLNVDRDYVMGILKNGTYTFQELYMMCRILRIKVRALFDEAADEAKRGKHPKAGNTDAPTATRTRAAGNASNADNGSHEHPDNTGRTVNNARTVRTANNARKADSATTARSASKARSADKGMHRVEYHDATPPVNTELQPVNDDTPDEPPFTITATEAQMNGSDAVIMEWRDMLDELKPLFGTPQEWSQYIKTIPKPRIDNGSTVMLEFDDEETRNGFLKNGCLQSMMNYINEHGYETTIEARTK